MGIYLLSVVGFYAIAHRQLNYRVDEINALLGENITQELVTGDIVEQNIYVATDMLATLRIQFATYGRENTGSVALRVLDNGRILKEEIVPIGEIKDDLFEVSFSEPLQNVKNKMLTLQIESLDSSLGTSIGLWYGTKLDMGKVELPAEISENELLRYNEKILPGKLIYEMEGVTKLSFGENYPYYCVIGFVIIASYCLLLLYCSKKNIKSFTLQMLQELRQYYFLIEQLVGRDFKTKYKRSVLGVLWSFLNPLLTMSVQYIIFSTLFQSTIPNFAVYLLIGIVCFSYFSEATSIALNSIVGNASLINKVFVPKYIYPLSSVASSTINLLLSFIPLLIVLFITKTKITSAVLLLPFGILCLIMVSLGIGMFLASIMVFFRDTQFLWNVLSMLWMYMTPIFYPEDIIPNEFLTIYKMNPLYHIIRFMRCILINGVSPEPKAYLLCLLVSLIPLLIGVTVFRHTQDKFVLKI